MWDSQFIDNSQAYLVLHCLPERLETEVPRSRVPHGTDLAGQSLDCPNSGLGGELGSRNPNAPYSFNVLPGQGLDRIHREVSGRNRPRRVFKERSLAERHQCTRTHAFIPPLKGVGFRLIFCNISTPRNPLPKACDSGPQSVRSRSPKRAIPDPRPRTIPGNAVTHPWKCGTRPQTIPGNAVNPSLEMRYSTPNHPWKCGKARDSKSSLESL
jgi:hypothetical protein